MAAGQAENVDSALILVTCVVEQRARLGNFREQTGSYLLGC